MRTFVLAIALALGGCAKDAPPAPAREAEPAAVPLVSVDEVDRTLAAGECVPVDVNGTRLRTKLGIIPGAVLLSDSEAFALSELPADKAKALVFYCANTRCTASHEAARRARSAGYADVKVMDEGIAGWVAAGKRVQTL